LRLIFGACVLDTETRQLLRAGEPVHLTPKAFELLQGLLERRPRVLSKAELREQLWPHTHVHEANLPNLVAEVRAAVADDARSPRFIRTVHGFGYAFCGEAAAVSRRHARLRISSGQAVLEDLGSRNGTFVMGERLAGPAHLGDGDEFRLGSALFTFRVFRTPPFPETRDP